MIWKEMKKLSIKLNAKYIEKYVASHELEALWPQVSCAHKMVEDKSGLGNDFLGWVKLPYDYDKEEFARIKLAAEKIKNIAKVFIVIGIGGSYLGAIAAIEFVKSF